MGDMGLRLTHQGHYECSVIKLQGFSVVWSVVHSWLLFMLCVR